MTVINKLKFDGVTTRPWREPSLHDLTKARRGVSATSSWSRLTNKEKMKIKSHFLTSLGVDSNPPSKFSQLKMPVVTVNGKLSKHAVDNADARLNQVSGLSPTKRRSLQNKINRLQREVLGE